MRKYHYFVAGHSYFNDGMDEPRPVNIATVISQPWPLLDDEDMDTLTGRVKAELDEEADKLGLRQEGYPVIREVNLLHVTENGVVTE